MKNADLHTHSYYSDGELSPTELIRKAKRKGIRYLALTDHNSVKGVKEAIREGNKLGIEVIPATEIIANKSEIIALFIDYDNPRLEKELKDNKYKELFKKCMSVKSKKEKLKQFDSLTKNILKKLGGFKINGWKVRNIA